MRRILASLAVLALVVASPPSARANSLLLDATTKSLEMETSAAVSTDYVVSYADHTSSAFTPGTNQGNVATATTTAILAAPGASTQRQVKWISVRNRGTAAQTVTLKLDVSATEYHVGPAVTLGAGEALRVDAGGALTIYDAAGRRKEQATEISGYSGRAFEWLKIGTASEAVGVQYAYLKDSGTPGAWVPGTPGLNGATTSCDSAAGAAVAGAPVIPNPATGGWYLSSMRSAASVVHMLLVADLQWYNTGIAVTTTTAQNITFPGPISRDDNGAALGQGVQAAIYVTTATTNAGAVTNTTLSYTDQSNNAGNTATIASFPATAVAGTFVPFQLAAGDTGIRSIQSVTLGTSYAAGAVSLVAFKSLAAVPNPIVNAGGILSDGTPWNPGIRMYNGTCLFPRYISSATTATTMTGVGAYMER
jgi:hypothetical protein